VLVGLAKATIQTIFTLIIVFASVRWIGIFLLGLHLLAFIFPDQLWGFHYLYFASAPLKAVILVSAAVLVLLPNYCNVPRKLDNGLSNKDGSLRLIWLPFVVLLMSFLYYSFPIALDEYGDAFQYRNRLSTVVSELPSKFYKEVFSTEFLPSMGRKTILYMYGLISYTKDMTYEEVFRYAGIFSGVGFTVVWIGFVRYYLSSYKSQLLMIAIGLFAPFTQIFYGHNETYAPVFFVLTSWLALLLVQHKKGSTPLLWALLALLLLCIRLHPFCVLLTPAWILSVVQQYWNRNGSTATSVGYSTVLKWVIAPIFLLGVILYFFVLEDYKDPRFLDNVKDIDRLFLPIISPAYPLDRYNLLGLNHIVDYLNVVVSWSGATWLLIIGIPVLFRDKLSIRSPSLVILTTTLVLFSSLLFMMNPLVSMPMDWDLFSFPAPVLLFVCVSLVSQIEKLTLPTFLMPLALALLLVASPFFLVNASETPLSNRLESVGKRMYRTYYLHSSRVIITALGIPDNMTSYLARKQNILDELKHEAVLGRDPMYGNLLMDDGYYYLTVTKDYEKAENRLSEAVLYNPDSQFILDLLSEAKTKLSISNNESSKGWSDERIEKEGLNLLRKVRDYPMARTFFESVRKDHPQNPIFALYLMEACFVLEDYPAALEQAIFLVEQNYPNERKALRIAVNCALEAKNYSEAMKYSEIYLQSNPEDKTISTIYSRIKNGDRVEELVEVFRKK